MTRYAPLALAALLAAVPAFSATGDPVLVNEVLASHTGTDDTEFIELFGEAGTSLAGLSIIVVESDDQSSNGNIDRRLDFGADDRLGANGYFLVGNPDGLAANYAVVPNIPVSNNFLENSSFTLALVTTESISGAAVSGTEVVLDSVALWDGDAGDSFFFAAPVVGPDGSFFPAGASRIVEGVDTDTASDWALGDFFLGPGNTPVGGDAPPPVEATIMEIQGRGARSPLEDQRVSTEGFVTAANSSVFWIQDATGDGDSATSDGILVADRSLPGGAPIPEPGQYVRLSASVDEQQFGNALSLTRLVGVQEFEVVDPDTGEVPFNIVRPVKLKDLPSESIEEGIAFWEPLEGMLVSLRRGVVVAPTSRFGEFTLVEKQQARPGSGFDPVNNILLLRDLGEGAVDYNPERIIVDDSTLDEAWVLRPGDRVDNLVGVVDYTFGNFKLQPLSARLKRIAPAIPAVTRRTGSLQGTRITSFNVENLFDLIDNPDKDDEGSTPSPEELELQLEKLARAIVDELELPAIMVLQEVENTAIAQELGDRVNAETGTAYVASSYETSDGRGIEVAFLYDAARVDLLESFQLSGDDVAAAFGPGSASPGREPLVGRFLIEGRELTIVGNHFKSKGGDDPLFGVNQPPIRITETQRKLQAAAVRRYVDEVLAGDADALVMIAGDLNDFEFSEPGEGEDHPQAILAGLGEEVPFKNLIFEVPQRDRYTFVFDGNSQVLDTILVSPALAELLVGVDILHFNAQFPSAFGEIQGIGLRSADHDPVEARFDF